MDVKSKSKSGSLKSFEASFRLAMPYRRRSKGSKPSSSIWLNLKYSVRQLVVLEIKLLQQLLSLSWSCSKTKSTCYIQNLFSTKRLWSTGLSSSVSFQTLILCSSCTLASTEWKFKTRPRCMSKELPWPWIQSFPCHGCLCRINPWLQRPTGGSKRCNKHLRTQWGRSKSLFLCIL